MSEWWSKRKKLILSLLCAGCVFNSAACGSGMERFSPNFIEVIMFTYYNCLPFHFLKLSLYRVRLSSAHILKLITSLLAVLSGGDDNCGQVELELKRLYELMWSHSEFVPALTSERDNKTKGIFFRPLCTNPDLLPSNGFSYNHV